MVTSKPKDTCPLCGAAVTYRGLNELKCAGTGCANWDGVEPVAAETPAWDWEALARQLTGLNSDPVDRAVWDLLTAVLDEVDP